MQLLRISILCLVLLGFSKNHRKTQNGELEFTFLKEKNSVNPNIVGYWKSIGDGYYLEARNDSILLYSYTKSFCYKEKNDYLERLLNEESQFRRCGDTIGVYLTDYGKKTEKLQTKNDFIRIEKLPEQCMGFNEMRNLPSDELFRLYRETIEENYAYKARRNLDWDLIFARYKDRISHNTDSKSLFKTMGEIATLTKDQHTKVISENGETLQYRVTPSAIIVQEVFMEQTIVKDLNDYFNLFFDKNYQNISEGLLKGKGEKVANGKLEWGSLNDNIGYLNIHSFTGFADKDNTRKQQIDSLNLHMKNIVTALKDKDAIIVDLSFNFGGYDASGLTIASYFTDKPVKAYSSQVFNNNEFHEEDTVVIYPADSIRFTKPVYVLMTDISRSAAESFAMMMGSLPNVKLVGTNTLGTLSGMLGKSIGDFYTTFSNQKLVSPDGQFYEVSGVEPDIRIEVFTKKNIFDGHRSAVNYITEIINDN